MHSKASDTPNLLARPNPHVRMVEVKLPESFINAIRKHGIDKNDVIFAATGDLDEEQRFADTVVALTKEKLIIILLLSDSSGLCPLSPECILRHRKRA